MMIEYNKILTYLPIRFKHQNEQEYIEYLWDVFENNLQNEKYQFSYIAYHMMFMSFVYFNVWQIKKIYEEDYKKIILGFNNCFTTATSPFAFSDEQESKIFTIFEFFKLGKEKIGQYKGAVKMRNEVAHSNGNVYFKSKDAFDLKIKDLLRFSSEIQQHTKPAIERCFENFLIESQNEEERSYIDIIELIKEELIHEHYFSRNDLEFCINFDINKLRSQTYFTEIQSIFEELKLQYPPE